jgi:hypothetical protein
MCYKIMLYKHVLYASVWQDNYCMQVLKPIKCQATDTVSAKVIHIYNSKKQLNWSYIIQE